MNNLIPKKKDKYFLLPNTSEYKYLIIGRSKDLDVTTHAM